MPPTNMEDTMKKTHIDLVRITPDMDEEQILEKLEQHLLKQGWTITCLLYTSPSPRDKRQSRMPSSA